MTDHHLTKLKIVIYMILFSLSLFAGNEQGSTISGLIVDSESGSVLSDVNVFLANTTIGAASDQQGKFIISHIPQGIYDLIFDCVGYETKTMQIIILQPQSLRFTTRLRPQIYNADKIQVIGEKPEQWLKNLERFRSEFIGHGLNANECVILNPEVLDLHLDKETAVLTAFTDSLLKIRNDALGYRIDVKLVQFECNFTNNFCRYELYPRFYELDPAGEGQKSLWQDNRQRSFIGSLKHFLFLFVNDRYFPLYKLYIIIGNSEKFQVSGDFLHFEMIPNSSLKRISFPNFLGFDYHTYGVVQKSSKLRLDQGYAYIDTLGNIYGPITKRGAWSEERIADLLPYNYKPEE